MTLQELYDQIGGDYEQVIRVLRVDKLIDKHIRKFANNGVIDNLLEAGKTMDPTALFETAHAAKGVCGNLGLTNLADAASEIAEEFRPGHERKLTDEEVKERLDGIAVMYEAVATGIADYTGE